MGATGGESRYRCLYPLGRGGTAEVSAVYVADRRITAALKIPLPDSADSQQTFSRLAAREAYLIGRERYPGIVRLLEFPDNPATSLLLELCSGASLDRAGRIDDLSLLLNILSSLAVDLAFLKARGIIHADIKPQNFFLPSNQQDCTGSRLFYSKLSDFSLGRQEAEPESARAGAGTVGYMAPETILHGRTSHQSDLFALGVIAYWLTTGCHPFLDEDTEPVRVNARVAEEDPRPLQEIRSDIPAGLSDLISSLLAKRESDRPRSAYEVCCALEVIGAPYPFRKALRPTHLMAATDTYVEAIDSATGADLREDKYLAARAEGRKNSLRLILSANWRQGRLRFDGERFSACGGLIWPSRMRRRVLSDFSKLTFSRKKQAVVQSVIADCELDLSEEHRDTEIGDRQSPARSDLLLQLLRQKTVRRLAGRFAPQVERSGDPAGASRLYVMAGDLANAERCACDASLKLRSNHRADQALSVLRRVVSYAELRGELFAARQVLMHTGDTLKEIGDADKALQFYQQIIELYAYRTSDKLLAETYKDLGDLYKMRQDFRSGIGALERALAIYRELNDDIEISHTLNNLGNIHWVNSDLNAALLHYRAALRIQRSRDLKPEVASTINNISSIYALRSRFDRSIRLLTLSLELNKQLGHVGETARTLNNLGYVYAVSGQAALAVQSLKESLAINCRIGSRKEQLFNLENLSEMTLLLGRVKESIRYLDDGLALSAELQDKPHLATLHLTLASAHLRLGQMANAVQSLAAARSFLDRIDDKQLEALYVIHCARIRLFLGDNTMALTHALRAAEVAQKMNDRHTRLQALLVATRLNDDMDLMSEAESIADSLHLRREKLLLTYNRIERFLELRNTASAYSLYEQSSSSLLALEEDIELPRLLALAAELLIDCGRPDAAMHWLEKALAPAQSMGLIPEIASTLALRAKIECANKAYEKCYAFSRQALQMIRQLAENINNDGDRAVFLKRRSVQNLMTEVRRLGAVLGQKQRAE